MKRIFIYCNHTLDQEKFDKFILNKPVFNDIIFEQIPKDISNNDIFEFLIKNKAWSLLHKNEHGSLHCTKEWITLTNKCLDHKIPVLSFDLGYFDHYKSFMVDFYLKDCQSSIQDQWKIIPSTIHEEKFPDYIRNHFNNITNKVNFYKSEPPPLNLKNIVVIWGQWSTDLIKNCFILNEKSNKIIMSEWLEKLVILIKENGFTPIIKISPVKNFQHYQNVKNQSAIFVDKKQHLQEFPEGHYLDDINAQLIAHAKYHIINCSSISNELLINNCKVIAMGKSWFNDLGIFYEPTNWSDIFNYSDLSVDNKNKWINWWIERQCEPLNLPEKIIELRNSII